jgi:Tfp pilus assembly protein PilF
VLDVGVKDADVLSALGSVFLRSSVLTKRPRCSAKPADLQPRSVAYRDNSAVAWLAAGDTEAALEKLQRAVALDPYNERSWLLMVKIYRQSGRAELARQAMERYGAQVPQSLTFHAAIEKSSSR